MKFKEMRDKMMNHFNEMVKDADRLFAVNVNKQEMWDLYLNSFPENENKIFRMRRYHDCSCCRHFIYNVGHIVKIKDGKLTTLWDFEVDSNYQQVLDALSAYVKAQPVIDIYLYNEKKIGTHHNFEMTEDGQIEWNHFYVDLPQSMIHYKNNRKTIDSVRGEFRDTKKVFKRALDEITLDSINTVLELIDSDNLYRGSEFRAAIVSFKAFKAKYDQLSSNEEKELFAWEESVKAGMSIGRIGNSVIGTLLYDISEGVELDVAVKKFETKTAPENYHRPKAIFTQKMLEDAKQKITDLGYLDSLSRRYAVLDDININDILFANKNASNTKNDQIDVFAEMGKEVVINPKKFKNVAECGIEEFINNILPTATSLEAYLENRHTSNMVSLIAPTNKDSKTMFKWGNNFSWAYAGNVTDSLMKERVKNAGGCVEGALRCSIQWNDLSYDPNDLDLHCQENTIGWENYHIYFGSYVARSGRYTPSGGQLDVDIINPLKDTPAVENIIYKDKDRMKPGRYHFYVDCYSYRGGRDGFRAEIEFDGTIHSFDYRNNIVNDKQVRIATVILDENGNFSIEPALPANENVSSKEVWGLNTNQFVPVSIAMLSPNHWNDQTGNKHYFFMLKDCKNPDEPNGFYNEFLKAELLEHKRVFEALGSKMKVAYVDDQLSGLGFSSTKRNDLVVKVKDVNNTEKVLRIKF